MIYADKIIKTISAVLRDKLSYPIKEVDFEKEIPRPCAVVECDSIQSDTAASFLRDTIVKMTVYIFAEKTHRGYIELLNEQQKLQDALNVPFLVEKGFYFFADSYDFEIEKKDMVLVCVFDVLLRQEVEDTGTYETMEELETSYNLEP